MPRLWCLNSGRCHWKSWQLVLKRSMLPLGKSLELGSLLVMIIDIFGYTPINCARGRPLRGQKRLAPLTKRSTCRLDGWPWDIGNIVWTSLSSLNTSEAIGPDMIPNRVLKEFAPELAPVIMDINNRSLVEGYVLDLLKSSIVNRLPKSPLLKKLCKSRVRSEIDRPDMYYR